MVEVFLGALLVVKCVQDFFASCLKLLINSMGRVVNHHKPTFFKVIKNVWHMMGSRALDKSIKAWNNTN